MKVIAILAAATIALVSAQVPNCDESFDAAIVSTTSSTCTAETGYQPKSNAPTGDELVKVCSNPSCKALLAAVNKAAPTECLYNGIMVKSVILDPITKVCTSIASTPATTPVNTTAPANMTSTPPTSSNGGSSPGEAKESSKAPLIGGLIGAVVVCVIIMFILLRRRRSQRKSEILETVVDQDCTQALPRSPIEGTATNTVFTYTEAPPSPRTDSSRKSSKSTKTARTASSTATQKTSISTGGSGGAVRPSDTGRWDDEVIKAVRVPLDAVFFGPLLASGGFGEVYKGTYRGETVAIKQLLPARRKDLAQIDDFLGEVKLMASLDHERIVRFIGVAWNSLSDVCAVVEYMENGDLRSVLTRWDGEEMRPQGFDADKVKIALHVAHALTYLHSLQPVVVHRDLKSKNILLTASLDAKLTDFGVSRERADSTMTAGVGSSLWMAPEVMMGERYNEKADVFSFGVVLSELDTQQLPYTQAKLAAPDQRLPDSAILQRVALGRLRVSFSELADADLVALGYDCVQVDPTQRPTTAEVLHRVHSASRRIL